MKLLIALMVCITANTSFGDINIQIAPLDKKSYSIGVPFLGNLHIWPREKAH